MPPLRYQCQMIFFDNIMGFHLDKTFSAEKNISVGELWRFRRWQPADYCAKWVVLPAPLAPNEGDNLTFIDMKIYAMEGGDISIFDLQVFYFKQH